MTDGKAASVRLIPELRNHQIESIDRMAPSCVLYLEAKYDLEPCFKTDARFEKVTRWKLLWRLFSSPASILEIQEPLWMRMLPLHIACVLSWKLGRPFSKRDVVSYAMENNEISSLVFGTRRDSRFVTELFRLLVGGYIRLAMDRLAFASEGSMRLYHSLPFVSSVDYALFENLPERPRWSSEPPRVPNRVAFLARLEARKGIRELMAAWSVVENQEPSAQLLVMGDGPLAPEVEEWCSRAPGSRIFYGKTAHSVAVERLQHSQTLVLPSVREGRWREQIGLPILEALQAGLTVVSSAETGLADWLSRNGHRVLSDVGAPDLLSSAIVSALREPISSAQVIKSLPEVEGRVRANHWMHEWGKH